VLLPMVRAESATCVACALLALLTLLFAVAAPPARAAESSIMLRLDEHSFISYSASDNPPLPAGSTIRFRFGGPLADRSLSVRVEPEDVSIPPVGIAPGAAIEYSLSEAGTGRAWMEGSRLQIELLATLVANLRGGEAVPPLTYQLRFTTGLAQAPSADQTDSVAVAGEGAGVSRDLRLVGAATNRPDAFPGPGEAVYAVLSGRLDSLPDLSGN
jgi:hypothetical protein